MFKVVVSRHIVDIISTATKENTGFNFKKVHCYRLLKNLMQVYNLNRDNCDDGYVMLCSKYLQNISHEYKAYMNWLESVGILEIDYSYQTNNYCRKYRIIQPDQDFMVGNREKYVQVVLSENKALRATLTSNKNTRGLSFLKNWLQKITIEEQMAHDLNWEQKLQDEINPRIGYKKGIYHYEPYQIDPERAYHSRKDHIVGILSKQFYISRDTTSGRLHSNITGLSSKIFPALRINGQPLVGYDIANSQPFICSALINFSLVNAKKRGNFSQTFHNFSLFSPISPLLLSNNHNSSITYTTLSPNPSTYNLDYTPLSSNTPLIQYLTTYLPNSTTLTTLIVMLEEILSEADLISVLDFQNHTISGNLYSIIASTVFGFEYENENKRKVKDLFFTLFFTKPGNNKNGIKEFKKQYPGVHAIINNIKRKSTDNNFFPILLQCLESYYILEIVCKRMNQEYPRAPLFTKHDSVYTTQEYLPVLKTVMEEEAIKLFGICPKLNLC